MGKSKGKRRTARIPEVDAALAAAPRRRAPKAPAPAPEDMPRSRAKGVAAAQGDAVPAPEPAGPWTWIHYVISFGQYAPAQHAGRFAQGRITTPADVVNAQESLLAMEREHFVKANAGVTDQQQVAQVAEAMRVTVASWQEGGK
jgi:hypothetical protein